MKHQHPIKYNEKQNIRKVFEHLKKLKLKKALIDKETELIKEFLSWAQAHMFNYIWFWRNKLDNRKGQKCRVLRRGKMNSILVEFEDGYKVITSRYAVRKLIINNKF